MRGRPIAFPLLLGLTFAAPLAAADPPVVHEVARVETPLSIDTLGHVLYVAHTRLFGIPPSPERLLVAWAHTGIETARGKRAFGNNVGNLVVTNDYAGDYYVYTVMERVRRHPDQWREEALRFRAYGSAIDGAVDYWRVIATSFASALARYDAGDARGAAKALCESGYSTTECDAYARGVGGLYRSLHTAYLHRLAEVANGKPADPMTDDAWAELERTTGIRSCVLETALFVGSSPGR